MGKIQMQTNLVASTRQARKRNLGFSAKVALRLARHSKDFLDGLITEEALRKDLNLRFNKFFEVRDAGMLFTEERVEQGDCDCCGRRNCTNLHLVEMNSGEKIKVGEACVKNIPFIDGSGYAVARRELHELLELVEAVEAKSLTKEQQHRLSLRRAKSLELPSKEELLDQLDELI